MNQTAQNTKKTNKNTKTNNDKKKNIMTRTHTTNV